MNRIGASRLQQAADFLGVRVSFFFEGSETYKPASNGLCEYRDRQCAFALWRS
jgi:hypothetical protein